MTIRPKAIAHTKPRGVTAAEQGSAGRNGSTSMETGRMPGHRHLTRYRDTVDYGEVTGLADRVGDDTRYRTPERLVRRCWPRGCRDFRVDAVRLRATSVPLAGAGDHGRRLGRDLPSSR